jgi:precorrin-2 dehydrogenase / sirohydrochlorin ferrochelatase
MIKKALVKTYPICLIGLEKRKIVVVGGGKVAARKVKALQEDGARVTLISPLVETELAESAGQGKLIWQQRTYQDGDLCGAFLAIAATDDPEVNRCVWEDALREGCLVNVVDDPSHSNFIMPAVVRRGDLKVAVTTGGASPALARSLRTRLEGLIGPEYEVLAELLEERRPQFISRFRSMDARFQAINRLLENGILDVLSQEGRTEAARLIDNTLIHEVLENG